MNSAKIKISLTCNVQLNRVKKSKTFLSPWQENYPRLKDPKPCNQHNQKKETNLKVTKLKSKKKAAADP